MLEILAQFYTEGYGTNVTNFFFDTALPDAKLFHRKMFFANINNGGGEHRIAIPPTEVTDHISGGWYFIRSKAEPSSYWYFHTDDVCLVCGDASCDAVHVSSEFRTKFCIRVRNQPNDPHAPEDLVMIGKDEISITAPMDYALHINDTKQLRAIAGYQGGTDLLFSDLKRRFIARAKKQANGEIWEYVIPVERGLGEAWELFDRGTLS